VGFEREVVDRSRIEHVVFDLSRSLGDDLEDVEVRGRREPDEAFPGRAQDLDPETAFESGLDHILDGLKTALSTAR
jgi:hypothetical protein